MTEKVIDPNINWLSHIDHAIPSTITIKYCLTLATLLIRYLSIYPAKKKKD